MSFNNDFNMYIPTRVLFGSGKLNQLHKQEMPGKKALIVTSNGNSVKINGYLERVEKELEKIRVGYFLFDEIEPNPLKSTVMRGAKVAIENNCDFIIALGGGSPMDAAKAISIMATNEGDLWDYVTEGTGKGKNIENDPLKLIAITTTAGTGSEADPGAVITNEDTNEKTGIVTEKTFPYLSIVDPELMTTVPPTLTSYQGFDALFHSIEGYISKGSNPLSDIFAINAIKNISENLANTVKNGDDLESREKVAFGNTLSGFVMSVGMTTSQHSLEHAMSAFHQDLPHGAGLIMLSNAYFTFFIDRGGCNERFIEIAKVMGKKDANDPMDFIVALEDLKEECGVSNLKMSDYDIKEDEFEKLAQNAFDSMNFLFDFDRTKLSINDCVKIYQDSYK